MNSRNDREHADSMDALIRQSLHERAGGKAPRPALRRTLLARAARQQRRYTLRLPGVLAGLLRTDYVPLVAHSSQNEVLYLQAMFGPRLGNFSFNQLMR